MSELKYKIGDKVILEGDIINIDDSPGVCSPYCVRFHDDGDYRWIRLNDKNCKSGNVTSDDWKLAGEIVNMLFSEIEEIFGDGWDHGDVFNISPDAVREKMDAYRNSKPKLGDVVECKYIHHNSVIPFKGILLGIDGEGFYWVLQPDENSPRKLHTDDWVITKVEDCKIDIVKALEEIK